MSDVIEIGMGKSARRAYGFDDLRIVSCRRTRDADDVDPCWQIDAFTFDLPVMASADGRRRQPGHRRRASAELGGVGVLHLEGLWTRYDDPEPCSTRSPALPDDQAHARLPGALRRAGQAGADRARIAEIRDAGVIAVRGRHAPARRRRSPTPSWPPSSTCS